MEQGSSGRRLGVTSWVLKMKKQTYFRGVSLVKQNGCLTEVHYISVHLQNLLFP